MYAILFAGFVDVEGNAASCKKIEGDVGESVEVDLELIDEGDSVELRLWGSVGL